MRSQRLQRFFHNFELDYSAIAKIIVTLMDIPQPWVLSTDRTEWSFGQTQFNILFLGVVHNGIAYPIVWQMLDKKGNSDSDERMDLLERFDSIFPDAQIAYVSGDREFVGRLKESGYININPSKSAQAPPFAVKKHGRLARSIFRYGLDYLRSIFCDLDLKYDEFCYSLQFLSCT